MDILQRVKDVEDKIQQWPAQIVEEAKTAAIIFVLEEQAKFALSRAFQLNKDEKAKANYQAALAALGD